ncbi:MAG: MBL fold metallo-hydrolase [Lachnospiraceae bacterium]|nr:MBL fold metallo-hydrolase [Lachnospiraceae bacterium]
MSLKITTLIENMPDKDGKLAYEHGFSVWIELENEKILFDTGQTGAFAKNAEQLGIDLSVADRIIVSHGHYDHTGGIPELLGKLKSRTPFYMGKEFFIPKYKLLEDGSYKYNGNPFEKELLMEDSEKHPKAELHYIEEDVTRISEQLLLFKNFSRMTEYEKPNPKFYVKDAQNYIPDLFPDEIALGIITKQGIVLIVGCSHVGIVNILNAVQKTTGLPVAAVLGGTHLVEADKERLDKTAEAMKRYGVRTIAVSHCTGEAGMELLKREFPEGFVLNTTGTVLEFDI